MKLSKHTSNFLFFSLIGFFLIFGGSVLADYDEDDIAVYHFDEIVSLKVENSIVARDTDWDLRSQSGDLLLNTGKYSTALKMVDNDDLYVNPPAVFNPAYTITTALSFGGWIKATDDTNSTDRLFQIGIDGYTLNQSLFIGQNSSAGYLELAWHDGSWHSITSDVGFSGDFQHVVATIDSDQNCALYIDGVLEASSASFDYQIVGKDITNVLLSDDGQDTHANYWFDDFFIIDRELTIDEILAIYESSEPYGTDEEEGETGQSCVVDYDTVIDLGEYDNAFACYAEEGFWDSFRQICFDYTCTDLYYDYRDYILPANYVCVVDLEDEEEEYEDYPSCIVGGGYWWLNTCYAMDCNQGFSSDDFGLDFDGENSTTTLADLEVSGLLALIVPANLPTRVHNFVSRNIMAFTTIFPLNILYNYNAFFYNMLDCAGEEQDDIYFNASLPIHFFPGQNDETQTLMDFGSLDQVNDLEIDIQGLHFDNLWDFSRKIFFLLLLLAYLNYVINFMGRIWGSGKK